MLLWIRVGDCGEYESFSDLDDALDYLNELHVGRVEHWVDGGVGIGFATPNYWGGDFISMYWGDEEANCSRALTPEERDVVECGLSPAFI